MSRRDETRRRCEYIRLCQTGKWHRLSSGRIALSRRTHSFNTTARGKDSVGYPEDLRCDMATRKHAIRYWARVMIILIYRDSCYMMTENVYKKWSNAIDTSQRVLHVFH